jgi:hypothetical protein
MAKTIAYTSTRARIHRGKPKQGSQEVQCEA